MRQSLVLCLHVPHWTATLAAKGLVLQRNLAPAESDYVKYAARSSGEHETTVLCCCELVARDINAVWISVFPNSCDSCFGTARTSTMVTNTAPAASHALIRNELTTKKCAGHFSLQPSASEPSCTARHC
eukprot:5137342-Amphidinium_carterae.1